MGDEKDKEVMFDVEEKEITLKMIIQSINHIKNCDCGFCKPVYEYLKEGTGLTEDNKVINNDDEEDENKVLSEEERKKLFCPVLKEKCMGKGCVCYSYNEIKGEGICNHFGL